MYTNKHNSGLLVKEKITLAKRFLFTLCYIYLQLCIIITLKQSLDLDFKTTQVLFKTEKSESSKDFLFQTFF